MYSMKKMIFMFIVAIIISFVGFVRGNQQPSLSVLQKLQYEKVTRNYMSLLWTNDYSGLEAKVFLDKDLLGKAPMSDVVVKFKDDKGYIKFKYKMGDSYNVTSIVNSHYKKIPFCSTGQPMYKTKQSASMKAQEIASVLGVSNLLDTSSFDLRSFGFVRGFWEFQFSSVINGYPSLFGTSIIIADSPTLDLYKWFTISHCVPSGLSTNVVLTAQQSQEKAWEYIDKYYPHKNDIKHMSFNTNRVEYVTPNYNFIRENAMDEFWDGGCTNSPSLVWKNYFDKHSGFEKGMPVVIYVDAETGEMLGGM